MASFKPFVPHDSTEREFTLKAVLAGIIMAAIFGAANAYLGMKAGQTVAATIPAAVIAIALFKLPFFRGGVLEQNLTRTAASVGEALVAGAIFTIPAFMMVNVGGKHLWTDLRAHFWAGTLILLAGGLLGVFFIIILRRPLCVDSPDLPFPESTASAEVVKAGQKGATDAPKYIFGAMGLGAFLQLLKDEKGFQVFKDSVSGFVQFPRSVIGYFGYQKEPIGDVAYTGGISFATPSASPALIGIGYIVGPKLATLNFSGGVLAWLILIPLVLFIDPDLPARLGANYGGRAPWDVVSYTVWYNVVRPVAVGAMLVGAVYTLYSMRESILQSIRGAFQASAAKGEGTASARTRLDIDIPIKWIVFSIAGLVIPITLIYKHFAQSWSAAILAAVVMTVSGFFLSAVGGYLVGLLGSSNQPVSGLTLAALVISALLMVAIGVKGLGGVAAVLGVASVVCCACCVSGSLIQDLKAGYLLGGTPWKMELVEVLSVTAVSFFLLLPIIALHEANLASGGIGGRELPAPQAGLMAQLAQGIVGGQMAWGLVLMGCVLGLFLVMIGAPAPMLIAVGMYLPLETTSAIFVGGALKWVADRWAARKTLSPEEKTRFEERGTLLASGFIAGEAITGILLAALFLTGISSLTKLITGFNELPFLAAWGGWISLLAFGIIAYCLIRIPLRKSSSLGS
ncbi:MAG TPA: oligopeptide transporter, OPT family [Terriglobia bacterium]|nr:oligopeptide transporter, OPT family [Terriglobia bacterium]